MNPLEHKGMPVADQLRNWSQLNPEPYNKLEVDPYTRCRIIAMNGVEVEANLFSHQFNRNTDVPEIKQKLAESRRIEAQQQKAINWLTPGDETTLEVTIAYEQVAVDLTAWLARSEPDPYLKMAMDFALLEDFDHLYRYANLLELLDGKQAEMIVQHLTEVMPGRPTVAEHRHPDDDLRRHYEKHTVDPLSRMHVMTLVAAEQQTMNWYNNIGNRFIEPLARGLYAEIALIEEQHVSQYESLIDPGESWFEMLVHHEYNEVYLYHSFAAQETDERIKALWELHLEMELGQLQVACGLMRRYEGREPEELLPAALPQPVLFQENKDYVRTVLAETVDLTADGFDLVDVSDAPARYLAYQSAGHDDVPVPSEQVIVENTARNGRDYRLETEGPHPVERFRRDLAGREA